MHHVIWNSFREVKKKKRPRQFTDFKGSYEKNNYRFIVCNLHKNLKCVILEEENKGYFIPKYLLTKNYSKMSTLKCAATYV